MHVQIVLSRLKELKERKKEHMKLGGKRWRWVREEREGRKWGMDLIKAHCMQV